MRHTCPTRYACRDSACPGTWAAHPRGPLPAAVPGKHLKRRMWDHALLRGRSNRSPSARALLHVRVVALRILTIVPEGRYRRRLGRRLWGGLHIDRGGRRDDDRRVIIRCPVWPPVGRIVRPEGDHTTRTDEDTHTRVPS